MLRVQAALARRRSSSTLVEHQRRRPARHIPRAEDADEGGVGAQLADGGGERGVLVVALHHHHEVDARRVARVHVALDALQAE